MRVTPETRSLVLETTVRLVFHTMLLFSVFLLVSGHYDAGGGFIGGLVGGLAPTLRYVAGGRDELREALPVAPGVPLGLGLLVAGGYAASGLVLEAPLTSAKPTAVLPVFGEVTLVTSLVFDVGVYLIVVGLVLAVLRTLGAEAEGAVPDHVDRGHDGAAVDAGRVVEGGPGDDVPLPAEKGGRATPGADDGRSAP